MEGHTKILENELKGLITNLMHVKAARDKAKEQNEADGEELAFKVIAAEVQLNSLRE